MLLNLKMSYDKIRLMISTYIHGGVEMKRKLRAFIALILAVLTASSLMTTAAASYFSDELPIVYVLGKVDVIYEDKDGSSDDQNNKVIYPVSIDDLEIKGSLEKIMPAYAEAFGKEYGIISATEQEKLDAWENYGQALYGLIGDIWDDIAMDENGEPRDNSGIIWDWNKNYRDRADGLITDEVYKANLKAILKDTVDVYGRYGLYDYTFHYDWRRDMYYTADQLNEYINNVLEVTGKKKCVLISRCYGCNVVAGYFDKYGTDKVETNIIYCSTAAGCVVTGEMFSGKFQLSSEGIANYLDGFLFGEDSNLISSIIAQNVKLGPETFSTFTSVVNKIYSRVSNTMMPKALITSFASMPGYWSMVSDNYYNQAKEFIFGDEASTTYRKLVEKIDYYHYSVTNNITKIFSDMKESGTNYANIVKYGSNLAPMVEDCDLIADGIVEVPSASLGATSGKNGETFSDVYMKMAQANDTLKYISPDATIDASTCLYPDYTWFAEGVEHFDFPESVDKLLLTIARYDGQMTVWDDDNFPQYSKYEGEGNLITWASNLYIENSRDETAGKIRYFSTLFNAIFGIIQKVFAAASLLRG